MSVKILTQNAIDNTNIDGARQNHFSAGMRSGIVKGAFNEGKVFLASKNTIALDTCELRISGHRVIIDNIMDIPFVNAPTNNTEKILYAEIRVDENSKPTFRLDVKSATERLVQENLFKNANGVGTYQLELARFIHNTDGTLSTPFEVAELITGGSSGGSGSIEDIVFNGSAVSLPSDSTPYVNIDYNEETGEYDFVVGLPKAKEVVVDKGLDENSTNPVQNAVITKAIGDISSLLDYINGESV